MESRNLKITEWLGVLTLIVGGYCYVYNYLYWRTFGINSYDYMGYADSLQRSLNPIFFGASVALGIFIGMFLSRFTENPLGERADRFIENSVSRSPLVIYKGYKRNIIFSLGAFTVLEIVSIYFVQYGFVRDSNLYGILMVGMAAISGLVAKDISFFVLYYYTKAGYGSGKGVSFQSVNILSILIVNLSLYMAFLPFLSARMEFISTKAEVVMKNNTTYKMVSLNQPYVFVVDNEKVSVRKFDDVLLIKYQ